MFHAADWADPHNHPRSQVVHGTPYGRRPAIEHVSIDHRRLDIGVAQQLLNGADNPVAIGLLRARAVVAGPQRLGELVEQLRLDSRRGRAGRFTEPIHQGKFYRCGQDGAASLTAKDHPVGDVGRQGRHVRERLRLCR